MTPTEIRDHLQPFQEHHYFGPGTGFKMVWGGSILDNPRVLITFTHSDGTVVEISDTYPSHLSPARLDKWLHDLGFRSGQ